MAKTYIERTSDGETTLYDVSFKLGFLRKSHVYVYLGEVSEDFTSQLSYTWVNNTQIELDEPVINGEKLTIRRVVPGDALVNKFTSKSIFKEDVLRDSFLQSLMIIEEIEDGLRTVGPEGNIVFLYDVDMQQNKIINMAEGTESSDAITKGQSDSRDAILQNQIDALQSPETSVGSLVALSGMPAGSIDLGDFDRDTIPANSTVRDALEYLANVSSSYGLSFKTVSDMVQGSLNTGATAEYQVGDVLHTCEYNDVVKQTWVVAASITDDNFGIELIGGKFAILVPSSGGVTPSDFGASRDQVDNSQEIQTCFDYCKLNNVQCTGVGRYYVDSTVSLETGFFSSSRMLIIPLASFASGVPVDYEDLQRRVIILNSTNITVTGLLAFNEFRVPDLVGMDYAQFQIKSYRSGAQNFAINNLVHSFSITITEGRGTGTGDPSDETTKGLVAYAPSFISEINALTISGGEWFGNIGGAIDIGDRNEIFDTILTAANSDFMGNGICITNNPTTDKGFISIDKVINVTVHAYFENQGSVESAMLVGGWFEGSVNGIEIMGYARDFDYYVRCLGSVRGINMRNCWSRIIRKSSLYLTSDIYPYIFDQSNVQFGSNTEAPVVHTGARAGIDLQSVDSLFKGCTIAPDGLYNGVAEGVGDAIYPARTERVSRGELIYENKVLRYYKTPNVSGGTITNNICTLNIPADARFFNGGDAVTITVNGTPVETYILKVDYGTGQIYVNSFGYTISTLTITQKTLVPYLQSRSFEVPQTTVGYQDGSVVWNIGTASANPDYWYLKQGTWVAGPSST